jgi:hypothetical protein
MLNPIAFALSASEIMGYAGFQPLFLLYLV